MNGMYSKERLKFIDNNKSMKNYPACKELKELFAILCSADFFFFKINF